jgi:hypothetical protein
MERSESTDAKAQIVPNKATTNYKECKDVVLLTYKTLTVSLPVVVL